MFSGKRSFFILGLIAVLFAMLAVLAVLQHRWLGEVSQAERYRMRASLETSAGHFADSIDHEITRVYLSFQSGAAVGRDQLEPYYAERFRVWETKSPHPRLVADLYLATSDDSRRLSLRRYDRATGRFDATGTPAELSALIGHLSAQAGNRVRAQGPLVEEIPALLIPVFEINLIQPQGRSATAPRQPPGLALALSGKSAGPEPMAYAIVTFNSVYLLEELVPALVKDFVASGDRLDYNIGIARRSDPTTLIYRSGQSVTASSLERPDATAELFRLRLDDLRNVVLDQVVTELLPGAAALPRSFVAVRVLNLERGANREEPPGAWQLLLKHRDGSLEAAVARSRRSNLAVSFGILLLLAVSLVIIVLATRRAQRLARQQMEFVAGVSHELRTPLSVICSAGENLADGVILEPERVKRYGTVIRAEGKRLSQMVEQVLEFAGIQSNRKSYAAAAVDVGKIIDTVLASWELVVMEQGFELIKEVEPNLPPVSGDATMLGRAVNNLVDNAIKYSDGARWVYVSARRSAGGGRPEVQISVSDRGSGISAADLPHILEPFRRGRTSVAAQIHGSGLGLSLVKHIVEAHGGRVTVQSEPGRGSTFTIQLPAAPGCVGQPAEATAPQRAG